MFPTGSRRVEISVSIRNETGGPYRRTESQRGLGRGVRAGGWGKGCGLVGRDVGGSRGGLAPVPEGISHPRAP